MTAKTVLLLSLLLAVTASLAAETGFWAIGDLSGGRYKSRAIGISGDGCVVVGDSSTAVGDEAFVWTAQQGIVGLGYLSSNVFQSGAWSCSQDGSVIVGRAWVNGTHAFRWTAVDGMRDLGNLAGNSAYAEAFGVSADGSVVVGTSVNTNDMPEAFRWTDQGMLGLGYLPGGEWSEAAAVCADGTVVVGRSNGTAGMQAFRWTATDGMVGLGFLPGGRPYSAATALSADGSTVVGMASTFTMGNRAFRWTSAGGMTDLGDLGVYSTAIAHGVSGDGRVVVGANGSVAFLWDESHGMRRLQDVLTGTLGLDLDGWELTGAYAVSRDGNTIVGTGINPTGNVEAWVARIPEPTALGLMLVVCTNARGGARVRERSR